MQCGVFENLRSAPQSTEGSAGCSSIKVCFKDFKVGSVQTLLVAVLTQSTHGERRVPDDGSMQQILQHGKAPEDHIQSI